MSQKVHLLAWNRLFDAQIWAINENEHKFDKIENAEDKIKKIEQIQKSLQPLRSNLHQTYLQDKVVKKNETFAKNPHKKEQVKEAISNFNNCDEVLDWKASLEENYKQVLNSVEYVPDGDFIANCVKGFFTQIIARSPLRPKALYDMPLKAILFRAQQAEHSEDQVSGVNVSINWDKIEETNRYISFDIDLFSSILKFIPVRNRYCSSLKDPKGSSDPDWYLNGDIALFLNKRGKPYEKIELKLLNDVSRGNSILPSEDKIRPYDMRRNFCTHLHHHKDQKMRDGALSAAGHGGRYKSDVGIFNEFYDTEKAESAHYVQSKLNKELNIETKIISKEAFSEMNSGLDGLKKKIVGKKQKENAQRKEQGGEELLSATNPIGKRVKSKFSENASKIDLNWKPYSSENFKSYKSRLLNIILHPKN